MAKSRHNRRAFFRNTGLSALAGAVGGNAAAFGAPAEEYDFDSIADRAGTHSTKWEGENTAYGRDDVIGMGIADMDFRAAPCVTRALAARVGHENWGYGFADGELRAAVAAWCARRQGLDVDPANVQLSSGLHCALTAGIRAFAPPGTRVVMTPPVYGAFYDDIERAQTLPEDSPLAFSDGRYAIDWDDLESRLTANTRVFLFCNPHNPTGNCWSRDDVMRLGQLCLEKGVVVFSDEIHSDFVTRGHTFTPFASLPDREVVDNSVTFTSATKSFNLAALRTGWFFSTNAEHVDRIRARHRRDLNPLGVAANIAALTEGEDWLDQVVAYVEGNHDRVESRVREIPLLSYHKAEGTYLAWIEASGLIDRLGARELAAERTKARESSEPPVTPTMVVERWLARNAGVHVYPGSKFGVAGETHMRMNLATSRALVDRALDAIAEAIAKL